MKTAVSVFSSKNLAKLFNYVVCFVRDDGVITLVAAFLYDVDVLFFYTELDDKDKARYIVFKHRSGSIFDRVNVDELEGSRKEGE